MSRAARRPQTFGGRRAWREKRRLEGEAEADARGKVVQIAVPEAIAKIRPAAIDEDAFAWGETILDSDAAMGGRPLPAVNRGTTADVYVRREAKVIDRSAVDQAAAKTVQRGVAIIEVVLEVVAINVVDIEVEVVAIQVEVVAIELLAIDVVATTGQVVWLLRVEPRGINADAEIARKEIINADAAAPAVFAENPGVMGTIAIGILAEDIDLPFLIGKTRRGFDGSFVGFAFNLRARKDRADAGDGREECERSFHWFGLVLLVEFDSGRDWGGAAAVAIGDGADSSVGENAVVQNTPSSPLKKASGQDGAVGGA